MLMCGVCAAIDKGKAGLGLAPPPELILRGMRTPA